MRYCLFITVLTCAIGIQRAGAEEKAASPDTITVVASGTGIDEKGALKQAFSNAITQAVGTIVDVETIVKNDKVISDQIITASDTVISKYDPIGAPKTEGGLVTVRIKAIVERRALTQRLVKANVVAVKVEGRNLFAQAVTELQNEQDAVKIVQRIFDGFPGNVLRAEPVGQPRLISKTATVAKIGVTVKFSVDPQKYAQWQAAFLPLLAKVATKIETFRWNPADADAKPLSKVDKSFLHFMRPEISLGIPSDDLSRSYLIRDSNLYPKTAGKGPSVLVLERQGSTRATIYYLDEPSYRQVVQAAFALPMVDIVLKDAAGQELDGQQHIAVFYEHPDAGDCEISASPFWRQVMNVGGYDRTGPTWTINSHDIERLTDPPRGYEDLMKLSGSNASRPVISPYLCAESHLAVSAFTKEFHFELELDLLGQLKSVESTITSKPFPLDLNAKR